MDYLDLKYALAKKGYTLTRVAAELGLFGPQSVQQVLFPDRYHAEKRRRADGDGNAEETRDSGRN